MKNTDRPIRKIIFVVLALILLLTVITGCGRKSRDTAGPQQTVETVSPSEPAPDTDASDSDQQKDTESSASSSEPAPDTDTSDAGQQDQTASTDAADESSDPDTESPDQLIDPDGSYTTKDDVALYLHTYGKLPGNFITKKEAEKLGWTGGELEDDAPGMCIGGDHFGNYEGLLPDGDYRECDIDTLGKKSRGPKRLIWDREGNIYYTDDHYESFTQLY